MSDDAIGPEGGEPVASEDDDASYDLESGPDPATVAAARPEPPLADPRAGDDAPGSETAAPANGAAESATADPTDDAVGSEPTVPADADVVHAVGIGPGNPEFLTPRGRTVLGDADVVVGFDSVVDYVEDAIEGDAVRCGYRTEAETLERFGARVAAGERGAAVLMGDPNHSGYQFLGKVERAVERAVAAADRDVAAADREVEAAVRVVPGISSLQVAASRARTPMESTTFVTLHRSGAIDGDLARLRADVGERHLLVLPRPYDWMPERIAAHLLDAGAAPDLDALVLERLTHADEAIERTTLARLAEDWTGPPASAAGGGTDGDGERPGPDDTSFSDLSVLAVRSQ